jgi:hypothetical protein
MWKQRWKRTRGASGLCRALRKAQDLCASLCESEQIVPSTRGSGRSAARTRRPRTHRSDDVNALNGLCAVFDHLDEVLYVVRFPEGDVFRGIVQFVSGRAQAITGCEPGEFVKNPGLWTSLLHPDDLPALQATTQSVSRFRESVLIRMN